MKEVFAYIDPGQGFVFIQNTPFFWAIILSLFAFFVLLIKFFFRYIKRFLWIILVIIGLLIIWGLIMSKNVNENKKVVILGIDALEPKIIEKLMDEGRLPNFSYLKSRGSYSLLKTTTPAESAVAWSSFATGLNPGGHGIFDFIMRNPQNYMPYLSLNEVTTDTKNKLKINIRRKGQAFWQILSKNKIPSHIYFCPNTFPAEALLGKMLSGMGVPDVYGTMGRFSFYTSKNLSKEDKESRGKIISVEPKNKIIETHIFGPKVALKGSIEESKIPLKITLHPDKESVLLEFQKTSFVFKKGTWSDWQKIYFRIGLFKKVYGVVRFYLKSIEPDFELYLSPINFDPQRPFFPISYPKNFSQKLSKRIGPYYTQGMPHDTWALTEDRLDEKAFLEQVDLILEERKKILIEELKEFKKGAFFFYIDTLDIIQHMFWRYIDTKHPLFVKDPLYEDTIFKYYERIDDVLGEILKMLDSDTTIIVLSDHGFNSFRRSVHLNRWLLENGFLFLKEGIKESKEFFEDVDWSKTKAYALGFGGIYINKIGREKEGIVDESEVEELKKAISAKLEEWQDNQTQERVIKKVYSNEEVFTGAYKEGAPDLFVGFNAGFRASWQTALGGVPLLLIEDNNRKWSGEHLIDPTLVPGMIFINKKINLEDPSIIDIAPTILKFFDLPQPNQMQGKDLF